MWVIYRPSRFEMHPNWAPIFHFGQAVSHTAYWKHLPSPWNLLRKVCRHCCSLRAANNSRWANFSNFSCTFLLPKTPVKTATLSTGHSAVQQGRILAVSVPALPASAPNLCPTVLTQGVFSNPHHSVVNSNTGFLVPNFRGCQNCRKCNRGNICFCYFYFN